MAKIASLFIAAALLASGLSTAPAAAQPNLPDLIITNISMSPANPTSGQAVTFTATIKNQGIAATPSGVSIGVNFFVDGNPVSTSDNNIISLAPGASVALTANLGPGGASGRPSTWLASAGSHTVLAFVDPLNRITESNKSNNSLSITITVTLTPPAFVIGDRVITTANLNVYATPSTSGTILGVQSLGSFGNVIGGPISANNFVWWNINYDIGADGWSVQDYQAKVSSIPTVILTANPTSITSGGSSTLMWSSTNATSCAGTGFTAGGTSGRATVSPTVPQTYFITCTGTGGTGGQSTTITVSATPFAALQCPSGGFSGLTITDGTMNDLQESCTINGNLVIGGTGTSASLLNIGSSIVLTVVGNVNLSGSGALSVNGGTLALANQFNLQYSINAADNANISMLNGNVTTNALGTHNLTSAYNASGSANMQVLNATLNSANNWLLAQLGGSSSLTSTNSTVPNEIYLNGQNSVSITGPQTQQGVHLNLPSGTSGSFTLPNTSTYYTWSVGSSTGLQVGWNLTVTNAKPGLAINSHANSNWTIIGANTGQKEVTISLDLDPPTAPTSLVTLNQLPLGIVGAGTPFSFTFPWSSQPQLTLNNVNLGPLAWQIYIGSGPGPVNARISNSAINEIGVIAGNLNVINSTLQLAELDPVGKLSVINVQGSDIWSHIIQASNGGTITIQNSTIHGNLFTSSGCQAGVCSIITLTNVTEAKNGTQSSCSGNINSIIQPNGTPLCNPLNPLQSTSTFTTSNGGIINR
ncbi:MAG: CARDB domain-containing protein [Methylocella sp.]